MILTPVNLQFLLHCYYSAVDPFPGTNTPAIDAAKNYLLTAEMIAPTGDNIWGTTNKGETYIKHLMTVPFPVSVWIIPGGVE